MYVKQKESLNKPESEQLEFIFELQASTWLQGTQGAHQNLFGAPYTPPKNAERVFLLLLSREERRTNIIGDVAEEYSEICGKHGKKFADLWYWRQVVTSAWPLLRKLLRLGLVSWLGEWVRKQVS